MNFQQNKSPFIVQAMLMVSLLICKPAFAGGEHSPSDRVEKPHQEQHEDGAHISVDMAEALGIKTAVLGSQTLQQTLSVYGQLTQPPGSEFQLRARYPGKVIELNTRFGQRVQKGQTLISIESNATLQRYSITSPAEGLVSLQQIAVGEQTSDKVLLIITETQTLTAELAVFPKDLAKITLGAKVDLFIGNQNTSISSALTDRLYRATAQQASLYLAKVDNRSQRYLPGQFVHANIHIDSFDVPLAVKTQALQKTDGRHVLYSKEGEHYRPRKVEIGRQAGEWTELLSGATPGSEYVTDNSYLIKAEIEKAGAAHDH